MSGPMIMATPSYIAELIRGAVAEALGGSQKPSTDAEWLDTKGIAAALGVHPRTIASYIRAGMPCQKLGPKTIRYQRAAVLAWIEKGKR